MGSDDVFVRRGGGDGPAVLLLHGLGATGDGLAAAVAAVLEPDTPLMAVGHSLGGGVALALARGWYRVQLVPEPVVLKGLGHNAHVEDPAALVPLIDQLAASVGGG